VLTTCLLTAAVSVLCITPRLPATAPHAVTPDILPDALLQGCLRQNGQLMARVSSTIAAQDFRALY